MKLNDVKILFRQMIRSKAYTIVNIFGLALGITCSLVIFLFVYDELTYDSYYSNNKSIYRLNGGWRSTTDGSSNMYPRVGYFIGDYLKKDFPEIDQVTRLGRSWVNIEKNGTAEHFPEVLYRADSNVFKVLAIPIASGSSTNLLPDYNSIVITQKMARKYYGRENVIGETLHVFGSDTLALKVTGVMGDYPDNTHLKLDFIVKLKEPSNLTMNEWFEYGYYTFFTLKPNATLSSVEDKIKYFTKPYVADFEKEIGFIQEHAVIPFSKIHLHSHLAGESNAKASYMYLFIVIGVFILAMACINFMNLATARSMKRAKEIGIRKVVGALRGQLARQFLGEALVMNIFAAAISVFAVYLMLPVVNDYSGKHLDIIGNPLFWSALVGIIVLVTLMAGGYPAFVLSAFRPFETLRGNFQGSTRGALLRKSLVVFQFIISVSLIAGTLIIVDHLKFLREKELGFDKEHVLLIKRATEATKDQLLNISGVSGASFSNIVPGHRVGGRTIINGWDKADPQLVIGQVVVDYDYVDLYQLKLSAGRTFDKEIPSDFTEGFMINEAALGPLGFQNAEEAIGKELWLDEDWGGKKGRIIGVLKNFHFSGVNSAIEPFSMFMHPRAKFFLSVKVTSSNLSDVMEQVEKIYHETVPNQTFEYSFLDETFDKQYQAEDRFMSIFSFFAAIGISIGCLGLYGLAMFMAEQRSKEVGVRKVLGATGKGILILLISDFVKLVTISFIIAIPVAYYGMEQWLNQFPFREKIDPLLFMIAAIVVLGITILTVGHQAMRAAMTNPVKTLRMN